MRYGRLDRKVILQRKSISHSASGQATESWSTLATRWASVETATGDERFSTPQLIAKQQQEFQVRWTQDIADLSPLDRLVYTAVTDTSPPMPIPSASIYDIIEVHEIGRREGLKIIAVRRADAS
jgi:head-tail adaptor